MQYPAVLTPGRMTDQDLDALRQRNEARAQQAVACLGARHVYHPANHVTRLPVLLMSPAARQHALHV